MNIFNNPWVVGIGTGVISSILVYFITKWIMDKKDNVAYRKRVHDANHDVIVALKPYIADNGLPNIGIFNALIAATARAYEVKSEDMYSINIYCEELVREVIADVYVSNSKKEEYTSSLADYTDKLSNDNDKSMLNNTEMQKGKSCTPVNSTNVRISVLLSAVTAIFTTVLAVIISYMNWNHEVISFWYPFEDAPILWLPLVVVLLVAMTLLIHLIFGRLFLRKKRKQSKTSSKE